MTLKDYDLAILTSGDETAGTHGNVWLKFDGSRGSTGWFEFLDPDETPQRRHFEPGRVDYGSLDSADLGDPQTCALELRGAQYESWLPETVELIDGPTSYAWRFGVRVQSGERVVRDAPIREVARMFDESTPSVYERSVAEARRVLDDACGQWRENDPAAPSSELVLNEILSIFDNARLILRK